jgi:CubicO group peptidase (beta-lactamase class C family)
VRWSYISGIIVLLGLFIGLLKFILDHSIFFSLSAYNLIMVFIFLIALVCIYFSLRSYLELAPVGWVQSALGIGGLLAISALSVWLVSVKQMEIENCQLKQVIRGVQARTGGIEDLDDKIEALMDEGDIPSLSAAIVVNDEIVWMKDYGESGILDKIYDTGSITKSFTAVAALQLVEQGLIGLDDDVDDYMPFNVRHPSYPDDPITVRMLLSNRSCLGHNNQVYYAYSMGSDLRKWGIENRGWESRDELGSLSYLDFMSEYLDPGGTYFQPDTWAECQPGSQFTYSTPGFDLLGFLIEQVRGEPLNEYFQENIFIPLKMTSTTSAPLDHPESIAIPYERWYGVMSKTNVQLPLAQRRRIGGGGLYSAASDLANFLIAHMNQGEFDGRQLLQPENIELMHSMSSQTGGDFMQIGYGFGWGRFQNEPRQMWDLVFQPRGFQGHGGRYWGYSSAMYMVEQEQGAYGYVLLINNSTTESMDYPWIFSIQNNIQDSILNEAYQMYQADKNH